ncbi:MAG: hypothetical protein H6765_03950 [Candidatus Peribacteria bacterium]|nr:MAG: hypothetical protein H6765_03950 [Candidatus Peribacteria bacterium]
MVLLGWEKSVNETDHTCYDIPGITEICITESTRRAGTNAGSIMSWLVVNGFGIALMWTIIFFALDYSKMTSKIS